MSENSLVEGLNKVSLKIQPSSDVFVVNSYGGYSKKGYAPYNPKKKNQDVLVMAEDPRTRSLLLSVMDGFVLSMRIYIFLVASTPPISLQIFLVV